jgi:hypothetical protein
MSTEEESKPTGETNAIQDALSRANTWLSILLVLFLLSLALLIYFQFYQGDGHWKFSLHHKSAVQSMQMADSSQIKRLEMQNDSLQNVINASHSATPIQTYSLPSSYYTLQIAAFTNSGASTFAQSLAPGQWETDGNISRLTIGAFEDYSQAEQFKNALSQKDIKGWLVKKVDGHRVAISPSDKP